MIAKKVFINYSLNTIFLILQIIIFTSCESRPSWEERAQNTKCEDKDITSAYAHWYEEGLKVGHVHGAADRYDEIFGSGKKSNKVPSCEEGKIDAMNPDYTIYSFPAREEYHDCWCKGYLDGFNNNEN